MLRKPEVTTSGGDRDRDALLLFDNAEDPDIRKLIPGGRCAVIIVDASGVRPRKEREALSRDFRDFVERTIQRAFDVPIPDRATSLKR